MKAAVLIAVALAAVPFDTHAQNVDVPGGLWETKMKIDMPGLPPEIAAKMGDRAMTHCVKPGEKKWTDQPKGPMDRGDKKCEQIDLKMDAGTVTWKLKCADGTTGDFVVKYSQNSSIVDGTMNSPKMPGGAMKMHMENKKIADTCEAGK